MTDADPDNDKPAFSLNDLNAALKSAVRAVLPGRQQKTNLAPEMKKAMKAAVRTLRRRARS